ncbi:hypothetical protein FB107DRAFT_280393, partial [Schizophyllum commune]
MNLANAGIPPVLRIPVRANSLHFLRRLTTLEVRYIFGLASRVVPMLVVPIVLALVILLVSPFSNRNSTIDGTPSMPRIPGRTDSLLSLSPLNTRHVFGLTRLVVPTALAVPILLVDMTLRVVQLLRAAPLLLAIAILLVF